MTDGDTLKLSDGRAIRLIAVNTPELGRRGRPDQPLAREAKQAVRVFLGEPLRVGLQIGQEPRDHHGRTLAYAFNVDGHSLAAHLLELGLGWRIAMPPNLAYQTCLDAHEREARDAERGVWSPALRESKAGEIGAGFGLVSGTVERVTETGSGWWIDLPGIALRLSKRDRKYFTGGEPASWLNRRVTVRGWIVDRSRSKVVRDRGYAPFMMVLRHPGMIEIDPGGSQKLLTR